MRAVWGGDMRAAEGWFGCWGLVEEEVERATSTMERRSEQEMDWRSRRRWPAGGL